VQSYALRLTANKCIYIAGVPDASCLSMKIDKGIVLREIRALRGEILTKKILKLLDVYFVKNSSVTVLPYPIKYLQEMYKA
jgi:hypothetical protein